MALSEEEKKQLIAKLLNEGHTLAEVQKILETEHNIRITYMELRMISSELDVDWDAIDQSSGKKSLKKEPDDEGEEVTADDEIPSLKAKTEVTLSKIVRPGAVLSGEVKFKSGKTAEWYIDQMGRLGLVPRNGDGQPSQEELMDFQRELQEVVRKKMGGGMPM